MLNSTAVEDNIGQKSLVNHRPKLGFMVMLCINYHLWRLKCESHLWIPNKLFTSTSFPHLVLLHNSLKSVHVKKQKEVWFETVKHDMTSVSREQHQSLGKTGLLSKWCCSYLSKRVRVRINLVSSKAPNSIYCMFLLSITHPSTHMASHHQGWITLPHGRHYVSLMKPVSPSISPLSFYQHSSRSAVRPEGTNTPVALKTRGCTSRFIPHREGTLLEVKLFTHPFSSELSLQRTRKQIFVLLLLETRRSSLEAVKNVPLHFTKCSFSLTHLGSSPAHTRCSRWSGGKNSNTSHRLLLRHRHIWCAWGR